MKVEIASPQRVSGEVKTCPVHSNLIDPDESLTVRMIRIQRAKMTSNTWLKLIFRIMRQRIGGLQFAQTIR
jgi:hypothetical protein